MKNLAFLISQQTPEHFQAIIDSVPASIYWKTQNGRYLGINSFAIVQANKLGLKIPNLKNINSIINKTDFDLFPIKYAKQYRNNDHAVMESKKTLTFKEVIITRNNKPIMQLSTKCPLYDSTNNVIGIIGNTVTITGQIEPYSWKKNIADYIEQIEHKDTGENILLPAYLKICLFEILQGKTAKQIGKNLSLSPRTVEHYAAKIKYLLGCSSCKELIHFYSAKILD